MVKTLGTAIIMTPLIAILECIALSKAFGKIELLYKNVKKHLEEIHF
jgi:hypothetical protein